MTREERAKSLSSHLLIAAARLRRSEITRDEYDSIAKAKIESFADAEGAAMRERAVEHMRKRAEELRAKSTNLSTGAMMYAIYMEEADKIAALPATGEVGR